MTLRDGARPTERGPARVDPERLVTQVESPDGSLYLLADGLNDAVVVADAEGRILLANAAVGRLFNIEAQALLGQPLQSLMGGGAEDLVSTHVTPGPDSATRRMVTGRRSPGHEFPLEVSVSCLGLGATRRIVATLREGVDETRLERALQDVRDLTEQLRRSQKIGALGRLAGGVAHDFNNLLQVIGGLAESLGAEQLPRRSRRRIARQIRRTTERAASLTRQLLAFGRRQMLQPEVVDLNETVLSLERMLTRVIGEDVHFVTLLAPNLRSVRVDPGQIEQVVLNLAINARDAMADGGSLEVSTANFHPRLPWEHPALPVRVPPGHWVRLSVRDTGCGMDDTTASQAFEPFFTTKDASAGSGLGLSMVYGIVKQSGGYTWIESAPSAGTVVHVLLPAVEDEPPARRQTVTPHAPTPPEEGTTLLLAEDDADVRALFGSFLRHAGYTVFAAADGHEALAEFDKHPDAIDIVVTDVVMPTVSGPALASAIRARRPEVKVLFVSGYSEQLELGVGRDSGTALLQKPVTRTALLRQVASLLQQRPRPTT